MRFRKQCSEIRVKSIGMEALFGLYANVDLNSTWSLPTGRPTISIVLNDDPRQPPIPRQFLLYDLVLQL
jgi:hypothetical protein